MIDQQKLRNSNHFDGLDTNRLNGPSDKLTDKLTDKDAYEQVDKLNYDQIDIYDSKEKTKLRNGPINELANEPANDFKNDFKNDADRKNDRKDAKTVEQSNIFELGYVNNKEEEKIREEGFNNYAFNLLISNRLGYKRDIPDTRNHKCKSSNYTNIYQLPKASVIICFFNEAKSTLFRTVQSVLDRTEGELIEEIILVNDFSDSK